MGMSGVCADCGKPWMQKGNVCNTCKSKNRRKRADALSPEKQAQEVAAITNEQLGRVAVEVAAEKFKKEDPPQESPDAIEISDPTPADIAWWKRNKHMGPGWAKWGELVTNPCLRGPHKEHEFQTHLRSLKECGSS